MKIIVLGLGSGNIDTLPVKNFRMLESGVPIFLRTKKHPVAEDLQTKGIKYEAFDSIYEKHGVFEDVYTEIVDILISEAKRNANEIIYGVPGHPMVAEDTVALLIKHAEGYNIKVDIMSAPSGLEAVYAALKIDPCHGLVILDALNFDANKLNKELPILFTQVYSKMVASELKLTLMEQYPNEHRIQVVKAAGVPMQEVIISVPLYQLDRIDWIDHLTSIYVPVMAKPVLDSREYKETDDYEYYIGPLVEVMDRLRGPDGCPWDKEQTHHSLKKYLIEEAYEVLDTIDDENANKFCEELGDLLLQIVFHAQIAREQNKFDMNDIITGVTEKLIRRHPHVFGDLQVGSTGEVMINWEAIKEKEKKKESILEDIPRNLPALMRAEKIQKKAGRVGFDWPDVNGAWLKVKEELAELEEVVALGESIKIKEELGDLFFAIVNVCRFLEVDCEEALQNTNAKFIKRFSYIEQHVKEKKLNWNELNLEYMDKLWEEAKKND